LAEFDEIRPKLAQKKRLQPNEIQSFHFAKCSKNPALQQSSASLELMSIARLAIQKLMKSVDFAQRIRSKNFRAPIVVLESLEARNSPTQKSRPVEQRAIVPISNLDKLGFSNSGDQSTGAFRNSPNSPHQIYHLARSKKFHFEFLQSKFSLQIRSFS
jgi:hypothetical protein